MIGSEVFRVERFTDCSAMVNRTVVHSGRIVAMHREQAWPGNNAWVFLVHTSEGRYEEWQASQCQSNRPAVMPATPFTWPMGTPSPAPDFTVTCAPAPDRIVPGGPYCPCSNGCKSTTCDRV